MAKSASFSFAPPLRKHKGTGQAYVLFEGKRQYFGRAGEALTQQRYHRWCLALAEQGRPPAEVDDPSVSDIAAAWLREAQCRYFDHDRSAMKSEFKTTTTAMQRLIDHYGDLPAKDFGPQDFTALRWTWIGQPYKGRKGAPPLARSTVNHYMAIIRLAFRHAVARGLIQVAIYQALCAVENLRQGRSPAKEPKVVESPPLEHVEACKPFLNRVVRALLELQFCTGARPGELVGLRRGEIDTKPLPPAMLAKLALTAEDPMPWFVRPGLHKTRHHGHSRVIVLGPKAQDALRPLLIRPADAFLFSPKEGEADRYAQCEQHRRAGQKPDPVETPRKLGEHYTVASYRKALQYACEKAGVPRFTPHQIRHAAGQEVRDLLGLEEAQAALGHATPYVTEIYAQASTLRAVRAALVRG